jgi:hypothetical protein
MYSGFDVESAAQVGDTYSIVGITEDVRRRGNYGAGDVISGSETLDIIQNTKLISGKNPYWWSLGRLRREMATATEARVRAPIRKWKLGRRHGRRLRRVPGSERRNLVSDQSPISLTLFAQLETMF